MITKIIKNVNVTIEGTWYEVSNTLTKKIEDCGSCEAETEQEVTRILSNFIEDHTILNNEELNKVVKRVIWNPLEEDFEQVQAVKLYNMDTFIIQYYNSNLEFISELETDYKYTHEVLEHIKNRDIVKGLSCGVLTNKEFGDCSNNGISKNQNSLLLIGVNIPKVFEAKDIRECVTLDSYISYIRCKPVVYKNKHYMAGGNFIYSSDSRFSDINPYPIAIHDRLE